MKFSNKNKQVLILYIASLLGTFLGMLVSILNTRNLSPADYGDFKYVNNLINFFSGILLFGYFVSGSRLLALAKDKVETREIKGGLVAILCITILFMVIIMVGCGFIHTSLMGKSFGPLFYTVIPVCGFTLCLNYINTTCQGDNSIMTISAARVLPQFCYLFIGYSVYSVYGASSSSMLLINNGIYFVILLTLIFLNHPSFSNLKGTFKKLQTENKIYGLQVYYGSLANVTVPYVAGITLSAVSLDNSIVGFYTLALTVTGPLAMLPQVIGTTYYKQFAAQNAISHKVTFFTWILTIISLIAFIAVIYPLVSFVYSDSYIKVAEYASFLALASSIHGVGDVYNRFLGAHGQGKTIKKGAWLSGAVSLVGYTLGVIYVGITGAIVTRILSSTTYFLSMYFGYKKLLKNERKV